MATRLETIAGDMGSKEGSVGRRLDKDKERPPRGAIRVKELDLTNEIQLRSYFNFLTDARNREHFSAPPATVEELRAECSRPGIHPLIAVRSNEIIGGAMLEDAARNQHDHFLTKVVINPDFKGRGFGTEMVRRVIDYACTHPTTDGRNRRKLDTAIIEGVPEWARMRNLVEGLGFRRVSRLLEQVDVEVTRKDQTREWVTKPVRRYELMLDQWRSVRGLPQISKQSR